jgi:hypothetical protein
MSRLRVGISRQGLPALALVAIMAIGPAGCASPAGSASSGTSGASHDPAPSGFPLLGSWTTTITKDDLRAGGVTEEGLLIENSGIFTWAFEADGTWRSVQAGLDGSPLMTPVFSGYFTVEDDVLVAVTEFPEQYRDEGLHYAFEVSGDTVTFDLLDPPDPMLPAVVESHPWARVQP